MSIETITLGVLVERLTAPNQPYRSVILNDDGSPLFYPLDAGIDPAFSPLQFDSNTLSKKVALNNTRNSDIILPGSLSIVTPVTAVPELKTLFYAMMPPVVIPLCPRHSAMLTSLVRTGGLPFRNDLLDAIKSFYAVFDAQVVFTLEALLDTFQIPLVDCGIYDLSGNRASGQNPELYLPLRCKHNHVAWIIFESTPTEYRYRFGVRLGPDTELLQIEPRHFASTDLESVINFVCGFKK